MPATYTAEITAHLRGMDAKQYNIFGIKRTLHNTHEAQPSTHTYGLSNFLLLPILRLFFLFSLILTPTVARRVYVRDIVCDDIHTLLLLV